ncbi:YhcN/YlaJ family sporulation lipoprotein [Bacillus aquiflavi]|uniref:YhcN/YlaJ family sporulation lipoprotein n=1 Tax=Bacillus aquiflavi TaxID=2672567 RepID=A0A6B3VT04_9BACI|nr:YhcN/YlaJ family sporulation lipoprotein [Bacillus aquiflavi]MBA4535973.1 YhcN/YlaJ family sporulation lipoprotein [Bacillus aquiflavi]NEY80348.1 YhcN/YlaJ family sporulation lipoprotein [Bacillus aquiflavi]UAC49791.1 YhcN/YlaJ family sporulation lipoprotein [Bacillus aquiflavi]
MRLKYLFFVALLAIGLLSACAGNFDNTDAARDKDLTKPARVDNNTLDGTRDYRRNDIITNDTRTRNVRNMGRNVGDRNDTPKMRVADNVADRIAALPEVDSANVIVTENNAYVAAKLDDSSGKGLTSNIERKISNQVKAVDRDIDNVYVSVNPDFYDRTTTYAEDIRQGRPISGFFDEFTETVRRIFPNNVR